LSKQDYWTTRSVRLRRIGLIAAGVIAASASASVAVAAGPKTLYVSQHGSNANPCSRSAPCQKIEHAVSVAHPGDTIIVEKGTYSQFVSIKKRLTILGQRGAVLNTKGRDNGFNITGKKASGTVIKGFVIENATFEGILAQVTSHLTISNNVVKHNDLGVHAKKPSGECAAQGEVPGDCGEGIHLIGVTASTISHNTVTGNLGGILLSDEAGPTAHNLISKNNVHGNVEDCGITVVAHKPNLKNGKPQPTKGGVYANTITGNIVNGNGTKGEGGGILLAAGAPAGAVYNNVIKGNSASGNGLAGVTIHSHDFGPTAPPADLNGNKILNNKLTHNGVADTSEAEFGGPDFAKGATVGILVGSGKVKLTGIVITGNTISNSHFGIYTKNDASKVNPKKNKFHNVAVKVKQV
jgi:parallel beta-helix repeat protein